MKKNIKAMCSNGSVIEGHDVVNEGISRTIILLPETEREIWLDKLFETISKDSELRKLILSAFTECSRPSLAADTLMQAREILSKKYDIEMEILT